MTYPSRVGVVAGLGLVVLVLALAGCAVFALLHISEPPQALGYAITAVVIAVNIFVLAWPVTYTLAERELVIRYGLLRKRVAYADIVEVWPHRSILGAPALSSDRLAIRFGHGATAISPKDKAGFLRDLASRDPALVLDGERLERRAAPPA